VILQRLEQFLMPRCCVFCGTRCALHEPHLCAGCCDDLPWQKTLMIEQQAPFEVAAALFEYAFPVDAALKALKFRRRLDYLPTFAALLARVVSQLPDDIDALLPVPLHWQRHARRGFNQARELCSDLRREAGLPVLDKVRRVRSTPYQSGLDASARSRNLRDAFSVRERITAQHVLIVDDVITTGATCAALAKVVLAAGAGKVSVLAVARA
jgi:ComF family protein